jgi:hypothetical protein
MKKKIKRITLWGLFFALVFILSLYLSHSMEVAHAADKAAEGPAACLACHGSFDDLVAKKASFKTDRGETVNPHQYIPHNKKTAENVPNCTDCHSKHPVPPEGKIDLSKGNVDSCFLACHHAQNFEPCSSCHKR